MPELKQTSTKSGGHAVGECRGNTAGESGYTAGIDIGSITTKAALMKNGDLIGTRVIPTGYNTRSAGARVFEEALVACGVRRAEVKRVVSTGYGRNNVDFACKAVTEITCHAAGAHFQNSDIRSVIDIGGQDSKVIVLNGMGRVLDFIMNDKCAAGTGRFLEVMARALEVDLENFGELSLAGEKAAAISSLCTVFAESEVISLIASGERRENIIKGIHASIAVRLGAMALRAGIVGPVMMTGGVSRNTGAVRAMEERLGLPVQVAPLAQENGAIGAAIIAAGTI